MNTNRIVNTEPLEDIDNDDDMLFTNNFTSSVSKGDITNIQKVDFRRYYEDKQKMMKNKKIIELVEEEDVYDGFTNVNFHNKSNVVDKKTKKIIKTENVSVISVDSQNRNANKYPDANSFKIDLGKSFYNVKSVKLISSSIPNTDQVIKETPPQIRNNLISWQNLEDQYLGIYGSCACSTVVVNTVDLIVPGHQLETQEYINPLTIHITNSTTTPSIDGEWKVTVVDHQTLRIPLYGGLSVVGIAKVDVGFPTYTVAITPGNYSIITLSDEAQRKMNLVKRSKGTGTFHYFTVESNLDTDITTFRSYITKELDLDAISTEISSTDILVQSEQHGFKDGDYVLMIGITSLGGLNSSVLNGLFIIKEATRSTFKYEVNQKATFSSDGGGNSVKTGKPTEFRFLFDTAATKIVYNIGFPDEDSGVFMNTGNTTPLQIYTKGATSVSQIGDYIEFTSVSHGLEGCDVIQINSISSGESPTIFLDSPHGITGYKNIFIYYPHSTPSLVGFFNVTVNGISSLLVDSFTVISSGSGLGEVKIGGDSIKLDNFRSIPTITGRQFPVEDITVDTFRIHVYEGLVSVVDQVTDTVVRTNNLHVQHPNHGFNELVSIYNLPFLRSTWIKSISQGQEMKSITRGGGLFVSAGRTSDVVFYKILASIDGFTWFTTYSSDRLTPGILNSVCYAPSVTALGNSPLYVCVGTNNPSNNLILTSSNPIIDNLITSPWTLVNTPFGGEWDSVCWSPERQLFVACGYVSNTENIMTSPDGAIWTLRVNGDGIYDEVYRSVSWSPELGIFVAVGYDITIVSSDGINWTTANNFPDDYWESIAWSSELGLFVAVASTLYATIESKYAMTSTNGYDWVQQSTSSGNFFRSVTWSPELGIFLAVGSGAGNAPVSSQFGSGSATPATLVLNASSTGEDDFYKNWDIEITSGLGYGQRRRIKTYNGTTKIATIYVTADNINGFIAGQDLITPPSLGDNYTLYPGSSESMMTSRDGITWISRAYQPASILTEVCWASDLDIFVSTAIDYGVDPDDYRFLISNITYGDIYCQTLAPHSYTGTRYNDADLVASTVVTGNVDIDIPSHGLVTNDQIIVVDSTTTPSINGSYFIEVVDSGTVRIPFTITSSGTCKVRKGDSLILTGTNSIPRIDGIEATVIGTDPNDSTYIELNIGTVQLTTPGNTGIIGRRNIVSLHRVTPSEPGGDHFVGIPLEIINNTYHQIYKIVDQNNYILKLGEFAVSTFSGGGSGITVSSERNGPRVFQSNTFTFEETGVIFRAIFLSGENYIFLVSPGLDTVYNPGNKKVGDIFAKILLKEQPGALVFDSFISAPKLFNPPIATIKELEFDMKRKDGYHFNFNNMDYSVSIEIVEIVDQIVDTGLSGRTGTSDLY